MKSVESPCKIFHKCILHNYKKKQNVNTDCNQIKAGGSHGRASAATDPGGFLKSTGTQDPGASCLLIGLCSTHQTLGGRRSLLRGSSNEQHTCHEKYFFFKAMFMKFQHVYKIIPLFHEICLFWVMTHRMSCI